VGDEGFVDKAIKSDINIKMLTDLAPTIIWTRDDQGNLTYLNNFWFEFTGVKYSLDDDYLWKTCIHPDDIAVIRLAMEEHYVKGLAYEAEFRIRRHDGEYRWFRATTRAIKDDNENLVKWLGVASIIHELKMAQEESIHAHELLETKVRERTQELEEANERLLQEIEERQKTQDALRQAQKMESVGQLTGGIAHDFNNMLTVIIGNLELSKMSLANLPDNSVAKRIERQTSMAIEAALKAEKLTSQLLAFSRKSRLHPERLNVNEVVVGVQEMVQRAVGVSIPVEIDLQEDVWLCLSDKSQLESAILNLGINARDAMPNGGRICIKTQNRSIDDTRFVSVSVSDTGEGMTQETKERAFEPFYTTKDVGKGSGLGLSMVYGFCQQSNGKVFIDSVLGKGTTVEMLFPYTAGETVEETRDEEDFNYDATKASILVVDDEPGVRELAAQALMEMGYNVLSAQDGKSALEIIQNLDIPIDLLFTDVVMPNGIDGFQLAKAASNIRPDLPVIFTTGHAEVALRELKRDRSHKIKVLGKPYRISDLNHMVVNELASKNG
jgi:PAS domain S-box-containing protein